MCILLPTLKVSGFGTTNDPIQFLFWSLDEVYPVAVGLIWGIWFDHLLFGILLGIMAIRLYQEQKTNSIRHSKP